jgi:hypothetical protein
MDRQSEWPEKNCCRYIHLCTHRCRWSLDGLICENLEHAIIYAKLISNLSSYVLAAAL